MHAPMSSVQGRALSPLSVSSHGEAGKGGDCVCLLHLPALCHGMSHVEQGPRVMEAPPVRL